MLSKIRLKAGNEELTWCPRPLTVVVGPNGAGKSTLLREVGQWFDGKRSGYFVRGIRIDTQCGGGALARDYLAKTAREGAEGIWRFFAGLGFQISAQQVFTWISATLEEHLGKLEVRTDGSTSLLVHLSRQLAPELEKLLPPVVMQGIIAKAVVALEHSPWTGMLANTSELFEALKKVLPAVRQRIDEIKEHDDTTDNTTPADSADDEAPSMPGQIADLVGFVTSEFERAGVFDAGRQLSAVKDLVVELDGPERLQVLAARGIIEGLSASSEVLDELRKLAWEVFRLHVSLDSTPLLRRDDADSRLDPRLAVTESDGRRHELQMTPEAQQFYSNAMEITDRSDGVNAFLGLFTAMRFYNKGVVLVDEPEAFLHPPLARRLGSLLSRVAADGGATGIIATHSSHFLAGCIDSSVPLSVLRIGFRRENEARRLHLLDAKALTGLLEDPLLRSAGVLDALFADSVVLCEGEGDCLVYRTAFEAAIGESRDTLPLFLSMHGQANIPKVLKALRRMGVRVAAVVDFDVLYCDEFKTFVEALDVGEVMRESILASVRVLKKEVRASGDAKKYKNQGLGAVADAEGVQQLISNLGEQGLFVVPCGELEDWPIGEQEEMPRAKAAWACAAAHRIAASGGDSVGNELSRFIDVANYWLRG